MGVQQNVLNRLAEHEPKELLQNKLVTPTEGPMHSALCRSYLLKAQCTTPVIPTALSCLDNTILAQWSGAGVPTQIPPMLLMHRLSAGGALVDGLPGLG